MTEDKDYGPLKIKNAVVKGASITIEKGTFLCPYLVFLTDDSHYSPWAGYCFFNPNYKNMSVEDNALQQPEYIGWFIWRVLSTLFDEVDGRKLEDILEERVRVKVPLNMAGSISNPIRGIGHFMKDKWFYPSFELENLGERFKNKRK